MATTPATARTSWLRRASRCLGLGAVLAVLPPVKGLPIFGYAAIAALLFGAVLLVPALTVKVLAMAPRINRIVPDTGRGAAPGKRRPVDLELWHPSS